MKWPRRFRHGRGGRGGRQGRVLPRGGPGSLAMVNLGVRRVEDDVAAKHPVRPAVDVLGGLGVRGGPGLRGPGGPPALALTLPRRRCSSMRLVSLTPS